MDVNPRAKQKDRYTKVLKASVRGCYGYPHMEQGIYPNRKI